MRTQIRAESGLITLDFLFSFVLVFGLTLVLLAMSLTLSVIEITQYITFATARNYMAAHFNPLAQEKLGRAKFQELTGNPVLKPLFQTGWYVLGALEIGQKADQAYVQDYGMPDPDRYSFTGARVSLNAKVLEIRIPFFGETYEAEDGFTTKISSFLLREPTTEECMSFNTKRFEALRQLDGDYQKANTPGEYRVMSDNGC